MAATAAEVARLRRMVNEADDTTYDDTALEETIESYPCIDERGEEPYTWDTSTDPPTQDDNDSWIATYDLNAAAADIWEEKAAVLAQDYDFNADGGRYSRSQAYEQAMKQARYYRSRRNPRTKTLRPEPVKSEDVLWVGNLPESD
jgi:hypothetical protein